LFLDHFCLLERSDSHPFDLLFLMELGLGIHVFPFCLSSDLIFGLGLEFLFLFLDLVKELLLLEFLSLKFSLLVGDSNGTGLLL